jgi:hypothetical protein
MTLMPRSRPRLVRVLALAVLCGAAAAARADGDAGQPGAYLRLGVGARAAALGDAYAALAEGPDAGYWNPAALAWSRRLALGSSVSVLSLGRTYNTAALQLAWDPAEAPPEGQLPLSQRSGLGAWSLTWLSFSLGNDFEGRSADTASFYQFADRQTAYLFSHGRPLSSWLAVGAGLKVYDRQIDDFSANGLGADLGLLVLLGPTVRLGVTASDLFAHLHWSTGYEEQIPVVVRSSLAFSPWSRAHIVGQLTAVEGRSWEPNFGLELEPFKGVFTRAGWKKNGVSLGAGLRVPLKTLPIQLDYAFLPDPLDQGDTQKIEVQIYF